MMTENKTLLPATKYLNEQSSKGSIMNYNALPNNQTSAQTIAEQEVQDKLNKVIQLSKKVDGPIHSKINESVKKKKLSILTRSPPLSQNIDNIAQVLPQGLWIGNLQDACNKQVLVRNGIKRVLSVVPYHQADQASFLPKRFASLMYITLAVGHAETSSLVVLPQLMEAIAYIKDSLNQSNPILVHCDSGVTLAPTFAVAYLIKERGMTLKTATKYLKETVGYKCCAFTRQIVNELILFQSKVRQIQEGAGRTLATKKQQVANPSFTGTFVSENDHVKRLTIDIAQSVEDKRMKIEENLQKTEEDDEEASKSRESRAKQIKLNSFDSASGSHSPPASPSVSERMGPKGTGMNVTPSRESLHHPKQSQTGPPENGKVIKIYSQGVSASGWSPSNSKGFDQDDLGAPQDPRREIQDELARIGEQLLMEKQWSAERYVMPDKAVLAQPHIQCQSSNVSPPISPGKIRTNIVQGSYTAMAKATLQGMQPQPQDYGIEVMDRATELLLISLMSLQISRKTISVSPSQQLLELNRQLQLKKDSTRNLIPTAGMENPFDRQLEADENRDLKNEFNLTSFHKSSRKQSFAGSPGLSEFPSSPIKHEMETTREREMRAESKNPLDSMAKVVGWQVRPSSPAHRALASKKKVKKQPLSRFQGSGKQAKLRRILESRRKTELIVEGNSPSPRSREESPEAKEAVSPHIESVKIAPPDGTARSGFLEQTLSAQHTGFAPSVKTKFSAPGLHETGMGQSGVVGPFAQAAKNANGAQPIAITDAPIISKDDSQSFLAMGTALRGQIERIESARPEGTRSQGPEKANRTTHEDMEAGRGPPDPGTTQTTFVHQPDQTPAPDQAPKGAQGQEFLKTPYAQPTPNLAQQSSDPFNSGALQGTQPSPGNSPFHTRSASLSVQSLYRQQFSNHIALKRVRDVEGGVVFGDASSATFKKRRYTTRNRSKANMDEIKEILEDQLRGSPAAHLRTLGGQPTNEEKIDLNKHSEMMLVTDPLHKIKGSRAQLQHQFFSCQSQAFGRRNKSLNGHTGLEQILSPQGSANVTWYSRNKQSVLKIPTSDSQKNEGKTLIANFQSDVRLSEQQTQLLKQQSSLNMVNQQSPRLGDLMPQPPQNQTMQKSGGLSKKSSTALPEIAQRQTQNLGETKGFASSGMINPEKALAQAKATSVSQSMKMSQKGSSRFPLIFGGAAGSLQNMGTLPGRLQNGSQRPPPSLELDTEEIYGYTDRISHGFLSPTVLNAASYSHHAKTFKSQRPSEMRMRKLAIKAKHAVNKEDPELDVYLREKKQGDTHLELVSNSESQTLPYQRSPPPEEKPSLDELAIQKQQILDNLHPSYMNLKVLKDHQKQLGKFRRNHNSLRTDGVGAGTVFSGVEDQMTVAQKERCLIEGSGWVNDVNRGFRNRYRNKNQILAEKLKRDAQLRMIPKCNQKVTRVTNKVSPTIAAKPSAQTLRPGPGEESADRAHSSMMISGVIDPHKDTRRGMSNSTSQAQSGFFNQAEQLVTLADAPKGQQPLVITSDILQSRDNSRNNTKMEHLAEQIKMINNESAQRQDTYKIEGNADILEEITGSATQNRRGNLTNSRKDIKLENPSRSLSKQSSPRSDRKKLHLQTKNLEAQNEHSHESGPPALANQNTSLPEQSPLMSPLFSPMKAKGKQFVNPGKLQSFAIMGEEVQEQQMEQLKELE